MGRLVGIAGGSGSGKSTLARAMATELGEALVVELDWYYRDQRHLTLEQREALNFDHPDALDWALCVEQLEALGRGVAIERPVYDFATHTRQAERVRVEPAETVLVEGILALHHGPLRERFDLTVFVDLDEETRFGRRLARDVVARGREGAGVKRQWDETVRPMHARFVEPTRALADLTADGEGVLRDEVRRVLGGLPTLVGRGVG